MTSKAVLDRWHDGLVPVVDLDGVTWWVPPAKAADVTAHSLAKLRAALAAPTATS